MTRTVTKTPKRPSGNPQTMRVTADGTGAPCAKTARDKASTTLRIDARLHAAVTCAAKQNGQTRDDFVAQWLWAAVDAPKPDLGLSVGLGC